MTIGYASKETPNYRNNHTGGPRDNSTDPGRGGHVMAGTIFIATPKSDSITDQTTTILLLNPQYQNEMRNLKHRTYQLAMQPSLHEANAFIKWRFATLESEIEVRRCMRSGVKQSYDMGNIEDRKPYDNIRKRSFSGRG